MNECPIRRPRRQNCPEIPQSIIYRRDPASMPRMRNLSYQQRTRRVGNVAAHAHEPAAGEEHRLGVGARGERLDYGTEDYEETPDGGAVAPAEEVGDVGREEEHGEAAEAGEGAEEAETGTCWVVEDYIGKEKVSWGGMLGVLDEMGYCSEDGR